MKPAPFELIRPATVADALQALRDHQDRDVKLLSGGQSLIPMMNFRVAQPEVLVDLGAVPNLAYLEVRDGQLCIGTMSRHADVKSHPLVARHAPLVHQAYEHVAHHSIRNRGTLGGNVAHADPASEMPAVMLALNATFVVQNADAQRTIPASEFYFAPFTTALEPDEMLLEIRIPCAPQHAHFAFEEVSLRKGDFAMSAVGVGLWLLDGRCSQACVAVAGVSSTPLRSPEAEAVLTGHAPEAARTVQAVEAAIDAIEFTDTATITAAYRRDLTRTLMTRALTRATAAKETL